MMGFSRFLNKRLCDIVFPGAHDAGIYGNGISGTAKTQHLNILEQALAGVRYFDLRITTIQTDNGLEQRAYHAPALVRRVGKLGSYRVPSLSKGVVLPMLTGVGADPLHEMLDQARDFVMNQPGELLILRFSKSANMAEVARQCVDTLGSERLSENVNLNEAQISRLQGKVITLFDEKDYESFPTELRMTPGILPVKALFDSFGKDRHATYNRNQIGLQYFGKYSNTSSFDKNVKKQLANMFQCPAGSPELLGMIYWTLTTKPGERVLKTLESIEKRDQKLWGVAADALASLWKAGAREHVLERAGSMRGQWRESGYHSRATGASIKGFMPNIVMMDFADRNRCSTVWNLNHATPDMFAKMGDDFADDEDEDDLPDSFVIRL